MPVHPVTGLSVLITGATDGLGRGLALDLARGGADVIVHGRSDERIAATVAEIADATGTTPRSYRADLASLDEVRALAGRITASETRLDVLVNNAGIGGTVPGGGVRQVSRDGHELRFAVNYLAPYLLTRLLLPLLRASAPSRVVNVSSLGQGPVDFDDVMLERSYSGVQAYRQSKLAQISDTVTLAEELAGSGVTVIALHPASYMPTKMVASPISSLAEGVDATARLVTDPALADVSGAFFDGRRETRAQAQAYDPKARQLLHSLSVSLTGES